jgi:cyclic pyranopterin phosphate synthase
VIPSVSEPFCDHCDRVRVTAEGKFRTCLFALEEFDLRGILRDGNDADAADHDDVQIDDRLASEIERAVGTKWAGHRIGQVNFVRPDRSMSQIGG